MPEKSQATSMSAKQVRNLLRGLNSSDPGPSWAKFIDRFSPLITKTASQFDSGQDRRHECFLYVCEKLCDDRFRRLQKFNTAAEVPFQHWLSTVVFNLCVDWHRKAFGRATVLPAISALPALDQLVYRQCYELNMDQESCYQLIRGEIPGLDRAQVSGALARIHNLLTPRQRWRHGLRRRDTGAAGVKPVCVDQLEEPGDGPEAMAQARQQLDALQAALARLPSGQQLLLRLRFQEGLTFSRIARMEHLGDPHRARRHVQAALDALYIQLRKAESGRKRQN